MPATTSLRCFVQEASMVKGQMKATAEKRCARCQHVDMAMLKTPRAVTAMTLQSSGHQMRCKKSAIRIAAIFVAAMWCTKFEIAHVKSKEGNVPIVPQTSINSANLATVDLWLNLYVRPVGYPDYT